MILSGNEIRNRLGTDIIIEPYDERRLNPNSYNLRLHNKLLVYTSPLDMKHPASTEEIEIPESGLLLATNTLYLARTVEYTETHNLVPMLEGRSSVGRLVISIHITAGFGDVGFSGYWTLEMWCLHPVVIYPYTEICQIYYHTIEGDITEYQSGKYQYQADILPSRLYQDFKRSEDDG